MKCFLFALLNLLFVPAFSQSPFDKEIETLFDPALKPFYFGVASGDPHQQDVIIWTKVWSKDKLPIAVKWEVTKDTLMQEFMGTGEVITDSNSAFTVKVLVKGLQPNTTYFYRFHTDSASSPVGRTRTAPDTAVSNLRFAVVSCSNYEHGYFNVYRLIANRNDLNAVIHLGDYIYEYGTPSKSKKLSIRKHIPAHEILTLQDYRTRYAQYRLDKDLQEVHRLHPFITVWDDHEIANNCYRDGAGNHQEGEGDWEVRKAAAKRVYFE
ncbi:MAG: alkaline phosphatase D family protein, partial [Bacteroidota bacterium]